MSEYIFQYKNAPKFVDRLEAISAAKKDGVEEILIPALKVSYDHNLLHLQSASLDSVKWEKVLLDKMPTATWHAVTFTATREEALEWKKKFEALPEVSQVAEIANKDLRFERSRCFYYLVENQRFITNFTSVSLYRYGRNKIAAQQFIEFYSRFQYQIASNRNQLSTFRPNKPNFLIRSLEID